MTLYTNTIKGLVTNYEEGGGDYKTVGVGQVLSLQKGGGQKKF